MTFFAAGWRKSTCVRWRASGNYVSVPQMRCKYDTKCLHWRVQIQRLDRDDNRINGLCRSFNSEQFRNYGNAGRPYIILEVHSVRRTGGAVRLRRHNGCINPQKETTGSLKEGTKYKHNSSIEILYRVAKNSVKCLEKRGIYWWLTWLWDCLICFGWQIVFNILV